MSSAGGPPSNSDGCQSTSARTPSRLRPPYDSYRLPWIGIWRSPSDAGIARAAKPGEGGPVAVLILEVDDAAVRTPHRLHMEDRLLHVVQERVQILLRLEAGVSLHDQSEPKAAVDCFLS